MFKTKFFFKNKIFVQIYGKRNFITGDFTLSKPSEDYALRWGECDYRFS